MRGIAVALLAAAALYGLFLDESIRRDPFTAAPGAWDWLASNQPHPALARLPVVPVGARGTLTFRPADTAWVNSPYFPGEADGAPAQQPTAGGPFSPAHAEEPRQLAQKQMQEPVQQQMQEPEQKQVQEPAQQQVQEPAFDYFDSFFLPGENPEGRPRIVHAQCLPANDSAATRCILARENDAGLFEYSLLEGGWTLTGLGTPEAGEQAAGIGFFAFAADGETGIALPLGAAQHYFVAYDLLSQTVDGGFQQLSAAWARRTSDRGSVVIGLPEVPMTPNMRLLRVDANFNYLFGGDTEEGALAGRLEACRLNCSVSEWPDRALTGWDIPVSPENADTTPRRAVVAGVDGYLALWTEDGGLAPTPVEVPTSANLRSIYFQDETVGWASSGWYDDNEEGARPVVLQTTDGGLSWNRLSYRELPAPWTLYGALPGLMFALYGFAIAYREVRNAPEPQPGIEDVGASDQPIGWNDPDVLGLKPLARTLSRFLRNRNTEPPLTIAVSGRWGSGKSSLMNLVAEDLRRVGTRPVWFNAWHHQKEEHLLAALLANIRSQAIPPIWRGSGLIFRLRLAALRTGHNAVGLAVMVLVLALAWVVVARMAPQENVEQAYGLLAWIQDSLDRLVEGVKGFELEPFLQGLFGVGTAGATVAVLAKLVLQLGAFKLNPAALMASLSRKTRVSEFSEQLSFRYHFARELGDVCRALRRGPDAGLVIMIDDLDRCRPSNVMDVLEAVNFLVSAGPCFVFLGVDKPKVLEAVASQYKGDAARYLEKLINIEVSIPEASEEDSRRLSLGDEGSGTSPWPDRIRRVLRAAPDAVVPAATAAAVLIALPFLRFGDTRQSAPSPPATDEPAASPTDDGGTGGDLPDGGSQLPDGGAGELPEIILPTVSPDELGGGAGWLPAGVVLLFLAGGIAVAALRRTATQEDLAVEDSPDFRQALGIWHKVIYAANPTPRGIKRHQNRLRFQAMRLRPLELPPGWIDRIFEKPAGSGRDGEGGSQQPPAAAGGPDISDAKLVAIGALHAYAEAHHSDVLTRLVRGDAGQEPGLPDKIAKALAEHRTTFPHAWPPRPEEIEDYAGLRASVRD